VFSGFGISKCWTEEMVTLRVLIQDEKQNEGKPRTAELWPDGPTNQPVPRENFKIGKKKKKKLEFKILQITPSIKLKM
jgi:hypothetical protein